MAHPDYVGSVREFHEIFEHPITKTPTLFPHRDRERDRQLANLRLALIEEEVGELKEALNNNDIVEVADALGDIMYVVAGAALAWGIPLDEVFTEIHRSNMSKLGEDGQPIRRADGKIMKGPHYTPPNIAAIIKK